MILWPNAFISLQDRGSQSSFESTEPSGSYTKMIPKAGVKFKGALADPVKAKKQSEHSGRNIPLHLFEVVDCTRCIYLHPTTYEWK